MNRPVLRILTPLVFLSLLAATWTSRHSRLEMEGWLAEASSHESESQKIVLQNDMQVNQFADSLFRVGLIRHPDVVRWPARILGWKNLRAGHYLIRHDETIRQALDRMGRGVQDPVDIVIPPGSTISELSARLSNVLKADSASFADCLSGQDPECAPADLDQSHLIGRLLPDTYSVYWSHQPSQILARIITQFDEKTGALPDAPAGFEHLNLDLDDIVTLASIVEWETSRDGERAMISRLYLNRLDRRMRLQADPTVIFAIGEKRRLFYRDYMVDHPYNTYQIMGLPPGPVTNPSMASIRAVIWPEVHDHLYMVATPEGYHEFNRTYAEHQEAARRWQDWIREQVRISRERDKGMSEAVGRVQ